MFSPLLLFSTCPLASIEQGGSCAGILAPARISLTPSLNQMLRLPICLAASLRRSGADLNLYCALRSCGAKHSPYVPKNVQKAALTPQKIRLTLSLILEHKMRFLRILWKAALFVHSSSGREKSNHENATGHIDDGAVGRGSAAQCLQPDRGA
jgi:hypothetical protein